MLCSRVRSDGGDARKQHSSHKSQVTSHQSLPAPLSFIPLRGSILRLRRAPSPRGCSYYMQYRTFISQPARYVAYERGKDPTASLPLTIWSSALHSWHTGLYVEGVPLRGTSILRLRLAPFGFIGRRPSGQARHLFGWSQTRESLCRTPVSKGLLVWHVIPCFRFSSCAFTRIRARQRYLDFASVDDTE